MKLVREAPPNFEEIKRVLSPNPNTVFAYGDTLYAPTLHEKVEIPDHLWVHEQTHEVQQGYDPAAWWTKYLSDVEFRLKQEIAAYGNQYRFVKSQGLPGWMEEKFLESFARDLSSETYGNIITHGAARSKIRNMANSIHEIPPQE